MPRFQIHKYRGKSSKYDLIHEEVINGSFVCYITVSNNGDEVGIACYTSSNTEIYRITSDGTVMHCRTILHQGSGPNNYRQESAHPHMAWWQNQHLQILDLGINKIKTYQKNLGTYEELLEKEIGVKPGSGARYIVRTKDGVMVFALSELSSDVFVYCNQDKGYICIKEVNLLTEDFDGIPGVASIRMSKDEQFVAVPERTSNTIAVLKRQGRGFKIIQQIDSGGLTPRDVNIGASNKWLLAANQDSHRISCFAICKGSGTLEFNHHIEVPSPA